VEKYWRVRNVADYNMAMHIPCLIVTAKDTQSKYIVIMALPMQIYLHVTPLCYRISTLSVLFMTVTFRIVLAQRTVYITARDTYCSLWEK
jgi:hypothetical protein